MYILYMCVHEYIFYLETSRLGGERLKRQKVGNRKEWMDGQHRIKLHVWLAL